MSYAFHKSLLLFEGEVSLPAGRQGGVKINNEFLIYLRPPLASAIGGHASLTRPPMAGNKEGNRVSPKFNNFFCKDSENLV